MILRWLKLVYGDSGFCIVWPGVMGLGDLPHDAASVT